MGKDKPDAKTKAKNGFILALANIAGGILGFFIPLPEGFSDYETWNIVGNIGLIVIGLAMMVFYGMRWSRLAGEGA